jgi:hypothetical protein
MDSFSPKGKKKEKKRERILEIDIFLKSSKETSNMVNIFAQSFLVVVSIG